MELSLQPVAITCQVSGEPFVAGARVASHLVQVGPTLEIVRCDVLEQHLGAFTPPGRVACLWVQSFRPRRAGENPDRALKLTAESLFVTLADPTTEPTPENTRLLQFLALMLERKKVLRPRGRSQMVFASGTSTPGPRRSSRCRPGNSPPSSSSRCRSNSACSWVFPKPRRPPRRRRRISRPLPRRRLVNGGRAGSAGRGSP